MRDKPGPIGKGGRWGSLEPLSIYMAIREVAGVVNVNFVIIILS